MMNDDENKDAFSKDVSVLEEEEEEEEQEEQEGLLKEERNENHLPDNKEQTTSKKKYKSEKSVKFLFREATKARNEHVHSMNNNTKGKKVAELDYEKEREEEEDFSTPDSKDSAQTMMQKQQPMKEEEFTTNNAKGHQKRRKEYVLPETQRPDSSNTFPMMGIPVAFPKGLTPLIPQKIVMSKVLQALKTKQHALVESPTGTGKSLALLCASLAFQKEMRRQIWEKRAKIGATPENKGLPDGWIAANGMFVVAKSSWVGVFVGV